MTTTRFAKAQAAAWRSFSDRTPITLRDGRLVIVESFAETGTLTAQDGVCYASLVPTGEDVTVRFSQIIT